MERDVLILSGLLMDSVDRFKVFRVELDKLGKLILLGTAPQGLFQKRTFKLLLRRSSFSLLGTTEVPR